MTSFLAPLIDGAPDGYCLRNERTGVPVAVQLITAFDSASRRTGLLHHSHLPEGSALIIAPTNAIHTFFMKFSIDVAFVTRTGEVVKTRTAIAPWRMSGALRAYAVIEMPAGALSRSGTGRGDRIVIDPLPLAGGATAPA
jgi:hypothetical protein